MELFNTYRIMFNNFDNTVRSYLSKTLNNLGLQYSHSQIFGVIFDGMKGIMQNILFYIEDALTEQNIFTATRKKSIYSLAKISGYEPYYGSSAVGTLIGRLHISNGLKSKTTKIYIQNYAPIVNKNTNVTYLLDLPTDYYVIDLAKPLVNHEFKIIQGYVSKATFTSEGKSLETMSISGLDLFDKQYVKVRINGELWKQVASLYDMSENGKEYICQVGYDNEMVLMFGNGVYGRRLQYGQTVNVEYIRHNGLSGNINSDEKVDFVFGSPGSDTYGNNIDVNNYMKLEMSNCVSGGSDSDNIEFIRNMVGKNSRSLVLASRDNFELFFRRFSFIGNINCWAETNSMYIVASCTKNLETTIHEPEDYFKIDPKKFILTDSEKEMIQNTLENSKRAFAGVSLKFEDPIIRKYAIICYVKVNSPFEKDIVKININKYLAIYFLKRFINTNFIAKSDIIKYLLDNIPEIRSLEISIFSDLAEQAYYNNFYYKYIFKEINGTYNYVKKKIIYEKDSTPGLDTFGNIVLNSKLEMPILSKIKYYLNKDIYSKSKEDSIYMDPVQVYFI